MTTLALVVAVAAWLYFTRAHRWLRTLTTRIRIHRTGAGASAAARARQLRTPAVRIAEHLGIHTQRGELAARSAAGAEGERRTAAQLAPLTRRRWTILHDRALPRGNANIDHLAISPRGVVLVLDTKRWSARWPITTHGGRLYHGDFDVTHRLRGLRHEADTVAAVLGVEVVPVVLMDGPRLADGPLEVDRIRIIPATQACQQLPVIASSRPAHHSAAQLTAAVARHFPPYAQGHR